MPIRSRKGKSNTRSRRSRIRKPVRGGLAPSKSKKASSAGAPRSASRPKAAGPASRKAEGGQCLGVWRFHPLNVGGSSDNGVPHWGCGKRCQKCAKHRQSIEECTIDYKINVNSEMKKLHKPKQGERRYRDADAAVEGAYQKLTKECKMYLNTPQKHS